MTGGRRPRSSPGWVVVLTAWLIAGAACSGSGQSAGHPRAGSGAADPARCSTRPVLVGAHPHAARQPTPKGRTLADTKGWMGRVYFGYGDLEANTGPIQVSSYDPTTATWQDLLAFDTEAIGRFRVIGDTLWAPAADPMGSHPEFAVGTARHSWRQVDVGGSLHVHDVAERAPGDVYLVGSDWIDPAAKTYGGAVWRSTGGATWSRILPRPPQIADPTTFAFAGAGALGGKVFTGAVGRIWVHDGAAWSRGPDLGGFSKPVAFRDRLVFQALGKLWTFDGARPRDAGVDLLDRSGVYDLADGRLVVVNAAHRVVYTTDLQTWTCAGQAPVDVASIGVLNGTIYFGGADARIYAYERPTW
jgi:hypothetical protein